MTGREQARQRKWEEQQTEEQQKAQAEQFAQHMAFQQQQYGEGVREFEAGAPLRAAQTKAEEWQTLPVKPLPPNLQAPKSDKPVDQYKYQLALAQFYGDQPGAMAAAAAQRAEVAAGHLEALYGTELKEAGALKRTEVKALSDQEREKIKGEYGIKIATVRGQYGVQSAQVRAAASMSTGAYSANDWTVWKQYMTDVQNGANPIDAAAKYGPMMSNKNMVRDLVTQAQSAAKSDWTPEDWQIYQNAMTTMAVPGGNPAALAAHYASQTHNAQLKKLITDVGASYTRGTYGGTSGLIFRSTKPQPQPQVPTPQPTQ